MRKSDRTSRRYASHEGIKVAGRIVRFNMDGVKVIDDPETMLCLINDSRDYFVDTTRTFSFSDNEINFESNNIR